jgi:PhnB protein
MIKFTEGMTENKELIGRIFHAELKINEFYIFMSDEAEEFRYENQAYKITVECDSLEDAQRFFNTLSVGGTVIQPFTQMEWGDHMGNLRDAYGITWDFIFCG